jgi:hypothetical protein
VSSQAKEFIREQLFPLLLNESDKNPTTQFEAGMLYAYKLCYNKLATTEGPPSDEPEISG